MTNESLDKGYTKLSIDSFVKISGDTDQKNIIAHMLRYFKEHPPLFSKTLNLVMADYDNRRMGSIAEGIGVSPAALSHYMAGRRIPPIDMIPALSNTLGLSPELEALLVAARIYDQEMEQLRYYVEAIERLGAYDRADIAVRWLERASLLLQEARESARAQLAD